MSYRSIKRVLGETNLERKCRHLFGLCLLVLIGCSFWWYGTATEEIINDNNRDTGRHLAAAALMQYHWEKWDTGDSAFGPLLDEHSTHFVEVEYDWQFVELEPSGHVDVRPPEGEEREILLKLREQFARDKAEHEQALARYEKASAEYKQLLEELGDRAEPGGALAGYPLPERPAPFRASSFARPVEADGGHQYEYFQAIHWQERCVACHQALDPVVLSRADPAAPLDESLPFVAIKVTIPGNETRRALNMNQAVFIAIGIGAVGLSMLALYVIVRYVIFKPLKHLRDVSDEISRGNTSLRAEIRTNDEFEDLADSFNRMLRHLVETQEELRHVNVDLDAKVDELAQVNMRLYEMNRIKSDFLANMSHELRTPLNSIIGFSDVLKGIDALNDKQKRYAANIEKSGRVLLEMINDILDLAKMEAGRMDVRCTEFRVESIVAAQCDMIRSLSEEKNIDVEVVAAPGLPLMRQDQGKVQQILTNLLSNAIKFTPEGGRIVVTIVRTPEGMLELSVEDTGVGIAEEDHEAIFEKFRQGAAPRDGDNLKREYSGTGLGLSIVKELCKLLGGEVRFTSELGRGSTFVVVLPWWREDDSRLEHNLVDRIDQLTKPHRIEPTRRASAPEPAPAAPADGARVT